MDIHHVEGHGYIGDALLFGRGGVRTGMDDDIRNAKLHGTADFDDHRFDRLLPERFVRRSQVDEIGRMGQRM